jgi:simple sugar transport system substrate-binding protein
MAAMLLGCKPSKSTPTPESPSPDGPIRLGYVLHGLNQFTETIAQGAKDAGLAGGVSVEVVGPAGFSTTSDAIALFEGLALKKVDGLVVIPMPGEVWVTPIRQAVEKGIPVLTANVTSEGSKARTWFGQDEFGSGVILANELQKLLNQQNKTEGTIVVGMCAPGVSVLVERYEGFKKGMAGSRFQITQPFDVNTEDSANYSAWENLVGANPKMVAIVGLCSMDLPNLAKLKKRTSGDWLVAGYDLSRETLDAVKTGTVQIALGQHPYLQGNLPILALTRHLRDKQPLPEGWIDVGTEVITKQNVESIYQREIDSKQQTQWYAEYIGRNFTNLQAIAKPLPGSRR